MAQPCATGHGYSEWILTTEVRTRRLLSGVDSICELLIARRALDERDGLDTAAFISGYPGSPLGTLDLAIGRAGQRLAAARVLHQPGLNEELAMASVWGSQMGAAVPYEGVDGVVGAWYGKGPGLDRSGDALKHANMMGSGPSGGAVLFVGDDPTAKSSTLPYDSNWTLLDACVPVLVPADQQDLFDLGIEAFLLSRFCGSWVGVRIVTAVADGIGAVDTSIEGISTAQPVVNVDGSPWQHRPTGNILAPDGERLWMDRRLRAAQGWAAARKLDRFIGAETRVRLGIICSGKTYRDVLGALEARGIPPADLAEHHIRVLKLAMTYPLARGPVLELAGAADEIVVIEEKRPFVEQQVRSYLHEAGNTTPVLGKRDRAGEALVPVVGELTVDSLAGLMERVLSNSKTPMPPASGRPNGLASGPALAGGNVSLSPQLQPVEPAGRTPAFCSGCPHNRSTVVPLGSITGGGVGCHGMIYFEPRHADETFVPPTPMGAEGAPWIGLAPFAGDRHLFQDLGDGTFSHSGSLAIRACVAAGVHVTFKLLYNSAVAMTGGQDVTGLPDVPSLTRLLAAEGVNAIAVCSDDVHRYGRHPRFAPGVEVRPREQVVQVQEHLRRSPGVSVLIYDQRCAAEARRLRKRGLLQEPALRVVINQAVCEGCGDCSRVSNCLSVLPVDTEFGERRQIHQSSCNRDYSCLEGDCPSFVTITPSRRRRRRMSPGAGASSRRDGRLQPPAGELPSPFTEPLRHRFSVYTTGIGGTGVVTANRLLAHAAVKAGFSVNGLDQTGLSQKAGAVVSHLHVAEKDSDITTATVSDLDADLYLSGDLLQAGSAKHLRKVSPGRSFAVIDSHLVPTAGMLQIGGTIDVAPLCSAITEAVGSERCLIVDASDLSERIFGTHLPANVMLLGAAFQMGALPLPLGTIEGAITEEGPEAEMNLEAFQWGRWLAFDRAAVDARLPSATSTKAQSAIWEPTAPSVDVARSLLSGRSLPTTLAALLERRAAQLIDYQGPKIARRWLDLVVRAAAVDAGREVLEGQTDAELTEAVAEGWFKLLTYKDEYEVARLHMRLDLAEVAGELGIDGAYRVHYRLHPPILRRLGMDHKIAVGLGARTMFRLLAAMRRLRGTPLDPFGYARHRRQERAIAAEYERLMQTAIEHVTSGGYQDAVALARSVSTISGYEDIKSAAIERWRSNTATLREKFNASELAGV